MQCRNHRKKGLSEKGLRQAKYIWDVVFFFFFNKRQQVSKNLSKNLEIKKNPKKIRHHFSFLNIENGQTTFFSLWGRPPGRLVDSTH